MKKDNQNLSKEKLLAEIKRLKKELKEKKEYGLVWDSEREPEEVVEMCKEKLPVLKEVKSKEIITDINKPVNLLIEGDNYHALSVLNYTHQGKVDVIYIDPPYNTGSGDFKYNDKWINDEDSYRHSKWLSFMSKRLTLAKNLLKETGTILIQIDDNEIAQLKMLMDKIFGEDNFRNNMIWAYRTGGAPSKKDVFSKKHDYILFYSKNKDLFYFNRLKEKIIYEKDFFGVKKDKDGKFYAEVNLRDFIEGEFTLMKDGILYKNINVKPVLNLSAERVESFPSQKPKGLMKFLFEALAPQNAVILDFFAGSGSTAYSILELNEEENKNIQFILCTNNENKICEEVTYPRVKKVIEGYQKNGDGEKVLGLGGNLKYFKTDFVDYKEANDKNKIKLTKEVVEMLCVKEETFELVQDDENFKIFKNHDLYTGIIFDQLAIKEFKKVIIDIESKFSVYIFSLGDDSFEEEFEDIKQKVKLSPIPEAILKVYRRIFK